MGRPGSGFQGFCAHVWHGLTPPRMGFVSKSTLFWRLALGSRSIRRRLAFQLKHQHLRDMDLSFPIPGGVSCPLFATETQSSFDEIFNDQEYAAIFDQIPMPSTWLDLGAFSGFFSMWVL